MANNTQQNKTFESIKTVKANVVGLGRNLQQQVASIRQQTNALQQAISSRKQSFAKKAEPVVAQPVVEVAEQKVVAQKPVESDTKKQVAVEVVAPVAKEEAPVAKQEPKVVQQSQPAEPKVAPQPAKTQPAKPQAQKPAVEPQSAQKPAPTATKVISTVENGREVKTYTDEKGNVRVRKFLDTSAPKRPQPSQNGEKRDGQGRPQGGRPQQGRRPDQQGAQQRRPQQGQGTFKKDEDTQEKRGQQSKPAQKRFAPAMDLPRPEPQKNFGNKNKTKERPDEKRATSSKKALMTRDYSADYDEDRVVRRAKTKKQEVAQPIVAKKITHAVVSTQEVPIKVLSERIGVSASEIIKQLFKEGIMKTINDTVDFDYAEYIAGLHEVTLELKMEKTAEEIISNAEQDDGLENNTKRPPIVTVMGHVDHGKTSLLDAIRKSNVQRGEAGGITQHIGAYTVTAKGQPITFIDTPGHAAFTQMRARGAKITDVAIIVVAADDGVMPQTVEAINHAKAAGVAIIVAVNKMDKPHIDPDRVKQQLTEYELLAEEWGGDTIMVPVSAKTGMGIDTLLESVLLVSDMMELKANPEKRATGTVIEAQLDKGRGPVATILVSNGTLKVGDSLIAGSATGKIRAMFDDKGKRVKSAGPSIPVSVLGFSEVPQAGDYMYVADEKLVKKAAEERKNKIKLENARQTPSLNLGDLFGRISEGQLKTLNLIIKTDVQGSLEALKASLEKISNNEVRVSAIHGGVGAINETDIMLAKASEAIIIGFNVRADSNAKATAEKEGVDIRLYNVIYDAVDDVTAAMKGMLAPKYREQIVGTVEVREVFKITGVGAVAGGYVTSGKAIRNGKVRIYRNDISIYDGQILALKRFKDDVKEVASGYECGISVENYNDIKVGDVFEIYQMEEIQQ